MNNREYKIGDLAREFNVTLRTLRFYEDKGLITPAREGTKRLYSDADRQRLEIALFCKKIGLSLGEIRNVLELYEHNGQNGDASQRIRSIYAEQLRQLESHRAETAATIADLQGRIAAMEN